MMIEIRMTETLRSQILADLARPHEIAFERVGFVYGKYLALNKKLEIVYLYDYEPVSDKNYLDDTQYAAAINSEAIVNAMQRARIKRPIPECIFHIHQHEHSGKPAFSRPDQKGLPPLIPGFLRSSPTAVHGLLLLSHDCGMAQVWRLENVGFSEEAPLVVVGRKLQIWS